MTTYLVLVDAAVSRAARARQDCPGSASLVSALPISRVSAESASFTPWPETADSTSASCGPPSSVRLLCRQRLRDRAHRTSTARRSPSSCASSLAVGLQLAPHDRVGRRRRRPAWHRRGAAARGSARRGRGSGTEPAPSCAPSIRPGMSASTKSLSPARTTPRLGCSVVNG